jgi:hypothetical protein
MLFILLYKKYIKNLPKKLNMNLLKLWSQWVKSESKEPPKWVDIPWNCIFVRLKNHKGNIIIWIVIISFGIFSTNYKVYMFKVWHKLKFFCIFKAFKLREWTILVFSNVLFFSTKCAPFLLKITVTHI